MARHSSFKNLIAYETYQRFFATVRARQRAHQDPVWDLGGHWEMPGGSQPPEPSAWENTEPTLPFSSIEMLPPNSPEVESWIESWLSGKASGPAL